MARSFHRWPAVTHRIRHSGIVTAIVAAAALVLLAGSGCSSKVPVTQTDSALARDLAEVRSRDMQGTPRTLADSQAVSVGMRPMSDSNSNMEVVATSPTATPAATPAATRPRAPGGATRAGVPTGLPMPRTMQSVRPASAARSAPAGARQQGATTATAGRTPTTVTTRGAGVVIGPDVGHDTSPDGPCGSPSPASQRACITAHLAVSDVRLNSVYGALINALRRDAGPDAGREPSAVRSLRSAQRAWIETRDRDCLRRTRGVGGPLWAPARAECLAQESEKRADELDSMLRNSGAQ